MDPAGAAGGATPSPRRELQGPRPSPLKVSKDSYKIAKKPPLHPYLPPPPQQHQHQHQNPQPPLQFQIQNQHHHRSPVIIYAVSPKVIHTTPSDFMSLVQRLTGNSNLVDTSSSSSTAAAAAAAAAPSTTTAAAAEATTTLVLSPAAAAAAAASPRPLHHRQQYMLQQQQLQDDEAGAGAGAGAMSSWSSGFFPGILSPGPASLQPISPSLFLASPSLGFDPSVLGYLGELSPVLSGHLLSTPTIPSPGAFWDLLNHFPDLS